MSCRVASGRRVGALGTLLCAGLSSWGAALLAQDTSVQVAALVQSDTVRVGDPFHVFVTVSAPSGAMIDFPAMLDTTSAVQSLDPPVVTVVRGGTGVRRNADYRVAAWTVGLQPVRLGDVIVRLGGAERTVSIGGQSVFVRSVLPADSAQRVPKPARPLIEESIVPWWIWVLLALALALAARLAALIRGRRRTAIARRTQPLDVGSYRRAIREFARIEALGLIEAGESGRYVALHMDVLREYLADRLPSAPLSLTTTELVETLRVAGTELPEGLLAMLEEADLVKFAKQGVHSERASELGRQARELVEADHRASRRALEPAA